MFKQCIVIICVLVVSVVLFVMVYVFFLLDFQLFVVVDKVSGKVVSIWVDLNVSFGIFLVVKNLQFDIYKVIGFILVIVYDVQILFGQVIIIGE